VVEKKSPAEGWPVVNGDYIVGDPESPVAAITMGSHLDEQAICDAGAAIAGSCKTENLGLEKIIANVISNPNIRFILCCGTEVKGHLSGQSFMALHDNGVDPDKRNIIGATGAIPYIENIPDEGIERFQKQLEIVNLIDVEDADAIKAKVKECIEKDPGAFEEEAMIIKVEEGGEEEEEGEEVKPVAPETALIEARMRNIQTQVKMIGSTNRMFAGMYSGKVQGIMIGLAFTLTLGILLLV